MDEEAQETRASGTIAVKATARQLELDIDRANWVVELILEARSTPDTQISAELIDRLSRNLFSTTESGEHAMTAADALASTLLGTAAAVRIPIPGGGELIVDKKGIRHLKNARFDEVD